MTWLIWLQELFGKSAPFFNLEAFCLDIGWVSSSLLNKTFTTWQHAICLSLYQHPVSGHFLHGHAQKSMLLNEKVTYIFRLFGFYFYFFCRASIYAFSFLLAAVTNLLLGLLPVEKKNFLRKHRDGQFIPWSSHLWQKILRCLFFSFCKQRFLNCNCNSASYCIVLSAALEYPCNVSFAWKIV